MPLKLTKRGAFFYVRGTVRGRPVYEAAKTTERRQAEAYRAKREAELFEAAVFGERAGVSFSRAAQSYLEFEPRSERTKDYVGRLVDHFGDIRLAKIDQAEAAPATKVRTVYTPLRAILTHAAARGWCAPPNFETPAPPKGKTRWLTPAEAEALIAGAAPHLRPLLTFYLCTGARVSEALDLQWPDVDLMARRAVLRDTKNGRARVAALPPAAVAALSNLPHRDAHVFRRDDGEPYVDVKREHGGQIKKAFGTGCRNAQIRELRPHDLRHTWATWFYALSKDMLLLKDEGGWRTLSMVERYAHLMPSSMGPQIKRVWGGQHPRLCPVRLVHDNERAA